MDRWQQWRDWLDERSLRERLLLFAAAAALLIYPFLVQIDALRREEAELQERLRNQLTQAQLLSAQSAQLLAELQRDPAMALKGRLEELRRQGEAWQRRIATYQQTLVGSDEMVALLRDLLGQFPNIQLIVLKSLPAVPIEGERPPQKEGTKGENVGPEAVRLYRRGVEVQLEGEYLALLGYVEALEKGRWRFLWGPAQFAVVEHPRVRLTITLFTLGEDAAWLRV